MGGTPILPAPGQPAPLAPGEFKVGSIPNIVTFNFDRVAPPSPIYVQRDDTLGIYIASSVVGESVTINARILSAPVSMGGQPSAPPDPSAKPPLASSNIILPIQQAIPYTAAVRIGQTTPIQLEEGFLLSVTAQSLSATQRGQTFVRAWINRGALSTTTLNAFQLLFSDYVTANAPTGWPPGRIVNPAESTGRLLRVAVATPLAGADFTQQVPVGARWRVISLRAQLVTSAAVANRVVNIRLDDGVNVYHGARTAFNQVASTTAVYNASVDGAFRNTDILDQHVPLPALLVMPNLHRIISVTEAIQALDQWSAINMLVEEWLDQT